jgi:hypothetical protein
LPLDPKFASSKPSEGDGFFNCDKNQYPDFLRREVKLSAHVVGLYMLKIPAEYDRDTSSAKATDIYRSLLPY